MSIEFTFYLVKTARKTGGDRYECDGSDWVIYVPQKVSRPTNGAPVEKLKLTIDRMEVEKNA